MDEEEERPCTRNVITDVLLVRHVFNMRRRRNSHQSESGGGEDEDDTRHTERTGGPRTRSGSTQQTPRVPGTNIAYDNISPNNPHQFKKRMLKAMHQLQGLQAITNKTADELTQPPPPIGVLGKQPSGSSERSAKNLSRTLQKAAHKITMMKTLDSKALLKRIAAKKNDPGDGENYPMMKALKALLSSDKTTQELAELSFDYNKMRKELKSLLKKNAKEEKQQMKMQEKLLRQAESTRVQVDEGKAGEASVQRDLIEKEAEEQRRKALGFGMTKDEFLQEISREGGDQAANQMIVARLMEALHELNRNDESLGFLTVLNRYQCLHPDSHFINMWTVIYVMLILYIATVGLFMMTFGENSGPHHENRNSGGWVLPDDTSNTSCKFSFTSMQWFDAGVDLFFIIDFFFRCFLFGQEILQEGEGRFDEHRRAITQPDQVLIGYARTGMLVDFVTGIPVQWLVMYFEMLCLGDEASGLLLARSLRILRVTRIIKIFKIYKVRKWLRFLRRKVGNNNHLLQLVNLIVTLSLVNHLWTCLSWLVQSSDTEGFLEFRMSLGLNPTKEEIFHSYSIMFMITLQQIFAIEPYTGDTTVEAWFGSLTLALSVFISATMLSKILDIWESANRAQTERDNKINAVVEFMSAHSITGSLRMNILDYYEFRYSNPYVDFEKNFLDDLPKEMQARVISRLFPRALEGCNLFKGASETMVSQLVLRMARHPIRTMPGQNIVVQGNLGAEMYLLKHGVVEVAIQHVNQDKKYVVRRLYPGDCFGEISLWMDIKRTATVTSVDYCQLYVLTRTDLEDILHSFPEMIPVVAAQAITPCLAAVDMAPALAGLDLSDLERIARRMAFTSVDFSDGETICRAGEVPKGAYVIRKGHLVVDLFDGKLEKVNSDLRVIGFTELLSTKPCLETIRTKGAVVAYKLMDSDLQELFASKQNKATLTAQRKVARSDYAKSLATHRALKWSVLSSDLLELKWTEPELTRKKTIMGSLPFFQNVHRSSSKDKHTLAGTRAFMNKVRQNSTNFLHNVSRFSPTAGGNAGKRLGNTPGNPSEEGQGGR